MDPQKRKISGGHVEYEQNRWLEAFGLSLNFAGTRDALAESPTNSSSASIAPVSADGSHLVDIHEAMGNLFASLLRELKLWLYREGMLETGLPIPPGGAHGGLDLLQMEALQRSTLHVSTAAGSGHNAVAFACAFLSSAILDKQPTERDGSLPFRPGVASSFLYMPLLAWDLNTWSGAVFSTMLATDADQLPSATDFLQAARLLLFGRVVQAIATPGGYDASVIVDDDELLEFWTEEELKKEKDALTDILCKRSSCFGRRTSP
jgi:hypothetical protein